MRSAEVHRNTLETQVRVKLDLDGGGTAKLATGIGFLDHMLDQIARHGMVDLEIEAKGDLHIDAHHTVEDVGITLGQALAGAIGDTKGVSAVTPPIPDKALDAAVIVVAPTTGPSDPKTTALVARLRDDVVPTALEGTAIHPDQVDVGGSTAEFIDITGRIRSRIVPFMVAVIAGSFILLTMVFRSLVVPLKAAVMNLLSIGAAYGVIVAIFQWGWGRGLIGLEETVPIIAFIPLMMFAILFGLSMDYEVFLLSRIREDYLHTGDPRGSVVSGLAGTARVITSAALIMISVFLSYVTNPEPEVKMIGLGMAVAVFVDATIVRMVLVPATMELLGGANWWLPSWLDRVLPRLNVEGPVDTGDPTPAPQPA